MEQLFTVLLITTGILLTIFTKGFQFTHFGSVLREVLSGLRPKKMLRTSTGTASKDTSSISQFQALCTALSATIGTGNISGIAYAITVGGPGAIFWMWIAALIGMITGFAEKVLGIYFRKKNAAGEWCGGPMYYLEYGLGNKKGCKTLGKILALMFSFFTIFVSFGMGNLSQFISIRESILSQMSFTGNIRYDSFLIGTIVAILAAVVILGGLKRIASANERLVPFMAGFYILGAGAILIINAENLLPALKSIFTHAFSMQAVAGGASGTVMKHAMMCGFKRGVFSNEAGLGSSVIVHASADVTEPVKQGMWGIFEVFFDTILICTLTALVILTCGNVNLETGRVLSDGSGMTLATEAFTTAFGTMGGVFMTVSVTLFAFATILGWNYYGTKAWEYLFGTKSTILYKYVYIGVILMGCTMNVDVIIGLSDTFNALMALPNLIGVISLTGKVVEILNSYKKRNQGAS